MYSSIDRVDVMGESPEGTLLVQTDHRSVSEIEKEPELSVLFALARVLNAQHIAKAKELKVAAIVYTPIMGAPQFLVDALGTVGAHLEDMATMQRTRLSSDRDPEELADHMFAALSAIVCERLDTEDPEEALATLEDEHAGTFGAAPDEDNEIEYWTTVFELMAVTGEVIRARAGGSWVVTDHGSVPFAFKLRTGSMLLPGNRAQRSLEEGAEQGMRVLLDTLDTLARPTVSGEGPILPTLRSRAEAEGGNYVTRPLFEKLPPEAVAPLVCYGHDGEATLALIRHDSGDPPVDHAAALANLRSHKVEIEEMEVAGVKLLSVGDSFFAAEKLLDVAFMKGLAMRLGDDMLGAAVPRRGVLLVTGLGKTPLNGGMLRFIAAGEFAKAGSRGICPNVIIIQHGEPIGMVLPGNTLRSSPPDDEPTRKRGFFSRLFGRN
ncbi:MAG TPA: hypothetical protein VM261_24830 [Kofleriaceae bacterium]|nr:hypothetical protein [Kofleriaceae bacterium]